ncbi:hypothetical protein [Natronoflexus pectinivorans]|uniref:VanZ like protein n=1 Tax=Natronoflexus pectinivorans TaxID=682526 RepID=A0A4V2RWG8_9BACT|nr:hypothetical protein [Natronoflexus pectinivorans]TCO08326.1 hypothetical protein EV194_105130 [Natronoflexus pectinivorans]
MSFSEFLVTKKVVAYKFTDFRNRILLVIIIAGMQYVLFYITRQIQYEIRPIYSNWFLDSLPSLNFALGLPFVLWMISNFSYLKSLILSLIVSFTHEILRFVDGGIPIDPMDLFFAIIGTWISLVVYLLICQVFSVKSNQ